MEERLRCPLLAHFADPETSVRTRQESPGGAMMREQHASFRQGGKGVELKRPS